MKTLCQKRDDAVMKPFFTCQTALLDALEDAWQKRLFSLFVSASGIIASIAAGSGAAGLLSQQHDLLKALLLFLVVLLGLAGSLFFLVRFLKQISGQNWQFNAGTSPRRTVRSESHQQVGLLSRLIAASLRLPPERSPST
jgi:hypothetical protein